MGKVTLVENSINFQIQEFVSFDVYRDGGSLSASFRDVDGVLHALIFLVDNSISESTSFRTYTSATIESYIATDNLNSVTGGSYQKTEMKKQPVSWSQARCILDMVAPLIAKSDSDYLWVFESMLVIARDPNHSIKFI
jgi:hypothetical protein